MKRSALAASGALILALAALLSGCVSTTFGSPERPAASAFKPSSGLSRTADAYPSPDITVLFYTPGRGFSIEYLAPGGRTYIWEPRSEKTGQGYWLAERGGSAIVKPGAVVVLKGDPYHLNFLMDVERDKPPFMYLPCQMPPLFTYKGAEELMEECRRTLVR